MQLVAKRIVDKNILKLIKMWLKAPVVEEHEDGKKIIGKPYSGKLNVRFDEGELEIEHPATTPALYSTEANC